MGALGTNAAPITPTIMRSVAATCPAHHRGQVAAYWSQYSLDRGSIKHFYGVSIGSYVYNFPVKVSY